MKVLVAGDWHSDLHESEVVKSLARLGHSVCCFKWFQFFSSDLSEGHRLASFSKRVQNKFVFGPLISKINQEFLAVVQTQRPELIFIYRGTHITRSTLERVKTNLPNCVLVGYNNDDPFSPLQPSYLWRHFLDGLSIYDLVLAYREANLVELLGAGAKKVDLMRSWYVPERNFPIALNNVDAELYECDVAFIGHYEPDLRLECLEAIAARGYKLRLYGPSRYWQKPLENSPLLRNLAPTQMVWGNNYNKALCGAKIALCFLSKLNRDTYTRRCFEIPATATFMLSEFSVDLSSMYEQGIEADFFSDKDELVKLVDYYIANSDVRRRVAMAGYNKVLASGHDIDSRMRRMIDNVNYVRSHAE